jgi:hypothetical protein
MHTGSQGHGSADPDLDQHQNIIFISFLSFVAVFGSGIRDPGSGMGKNQDPGLTSRIRNTATNTGFDYGYKSRIIIIEVLQIRDPVPLHPSLWLLCCFWIRDPGWVKIRIRDKHPGSATLLQIWALTMDQNPE